MDILATATLTESEESAAVAGAAAGAVAGVAVMIAVFAVIYYILTVIATWRIFKKAGEPGWKCLIPFYNIYIMFKIVGMKNWFWWVLGIGILTGIVMSVDGTANLTDEQLQSLDWSKHIATLIFAFVSFIVDICVEIVYAWRTSKVFGHSTGYFLGLLFLQPIFWLILGFDKSKYDKKELKKFAKK